jgi:hypothetical protein
MPARRRLQALSRHVVAYNKPPVTASAAASAAAAATTLLSAGKVPRRVAVADRPAIEQALREEGVVVVTDLPGDESAPGYWEAAAAELPALCFGDVRLGNPRMEQGNEQQVPSEPPSYALTPRDCAQLFERAVKAELSNNYVIVHGSSAHRRMFLDIESTREALGYEPQDGTAFPRVATGDLTFGGKM